MNDKQEKLKRSTEKILRNIFAEQFGKDVAFTVTFKDTPEDMLAGDAYAGEITITPVKKRG